MRRKKILKLLLWIFITVFFLMNAVAAMHAWKFTHFSDSGIEKTKDPKHLSFGAKLSALLFGVANPRPVGQALPSQPFDTVQLQSNKRIECWSILRDSSRHSSRGSHNAGDSTKGTVILFHGYGGEKSSMLDKSDIFQQLGYNTLLVDFMGSGGSEGNRTTIGFREAEEVMTCYTYLAGKGESHIYLFGTSMGAVAILKAIKDYRLTPAGIILECPFGTLYKTVCARFRSMDVPVFPMAGLLVFWGGVENGFWAFSHKPVEYARAVGCPTLLLYGEKDEKVSLGETEDLFANLHGRKKLHVYPFAGHENYLHQYKQEWTHDVGHFLNVSSR
ncbi:MAG TPA: alpha/beta hydrolase [Puia sp.]|nr:alpha/beta hydrolase [Puia sp.]